MSSSFLYSKNKIEVYMYVHIHKYMCKRKLK